MRARGNIPFEVRKEMCPMRRWAMELPSAVLPADRC